MIFCIKQEYSEIVRKMLSPDASLLNDEQANVLSEYIKGIYISFKLSKMPDLNFFNFSTIEWEKNLYISSRESEYVKCIMYSKSILSDIEAIVATKRCDLHLIPFNVAFTEMELIEMTKHLECALVDDFNDLKHLNNHQALQRIIDDTVIKCAKNNQFFKIDYQDESWIDWDMIR